MMQKPMFSSTFVASRPSVISHKGLSKKAGAAVIRRRRRRSAAPCGSTTAGYGVLDYKDLSDILSIMVQNPREEGSP